MSRIDPAEFHAAFGVGVPDHVDPVDAVGVLLAAVQGLELRLRETDAELALLKQELAALKRQRGGRGA